MLSDGDAVFQPRKVERSGLWKAFGGEILIYVHKEQELDDVERLYPARHYVLIDDKLRILSAVKKVWGDRVTTVFPRQGHYANDPDGARSLSAGRRHRRADRRPASRSTARRSRPRVSHVLEHRRQGHDRDDGADGPAGVEGASERITRA